MLMFKVVKTRWNDYCSLVGDLVYYMDRKTVPRFGKLFCFEKLEDALRYRIRGEMILEGEGTRCTDTKWPNIDRSVAPSAWDGTGKVDDFPIGTILAEDFTPRRVIN